MIPPQRPAILSGLVALMVILGVFQTLYGVTFFAFAFPYPVCSGILVVFGAMDFIVAAGLYWTQGWARLAAIAMGVTSAIFALPVGTVPAILLLVYLFKPEVKAAFGQGPPAGPPGYGYPPPYAPARWPNAPYPPGSPAQGLRPTSPVLASQPPRSTRCPDCGAPVDAGARQCGVCGSRIP